MTTQTIIQAAPFNTGVSEMRSNQGNDVAVAAAQLGGAALGGYAGYRAGSVGGAIGGLLIGSALGTFVAARSGAKTTVGDGFGVFGGLLFGVPILVTSAVITSLTQKR